MVENTKDVNKVRHEQRLENHRAKVEKLNGFLLKSAMVQKAIRLDKITIFWQKTGSQIH